MVEWGAPDSDGGAPLEGYKVAVRDAKRQMWMEVGRVQADVQKLQVKDLAVSQFISEKRKRLKFKNENKIYNTVQISQISNPFQEGNNYLIRIFAKNEVGFSDPLENEEPFKVERPAGYTGEEEKEDAKHDETPSLR